jgi:hypothetical protein
MLPFLILVFLFSVLLYINKKKKKKKINNIKKTNYIKALGYRLIHSVLEVTGLLPQGEGVRKDFCANVGHSLSK